MQYSSKILEMEIVRAEKNFKDYSIYISGFMDEEMKAMKVNVLRAHKGTQDQCSFCSLCFSSRVSLQSSKLAKA